MRRLPQFEIAIHEAAHYVASFRLFPTRFRWKLSIRRDDYSLGASIEEECGDTEFDLTNEAIVLYAGYCANTSITDTQEEIANNGARSDFKKAARIVEQLSVEQKDLIANSRKIVLENKSSITSLAYELEKYKELESDEADLIILKSDGDPDAETALISPRQLKGI